MLICKEKGVCKILPLPLSSALQDAMSLCFQKGYLNDEYPTSYEKMLYPTAGVSNCKIWALHFEE